MFTEEERAKITQELDAFIAKNRPPEEVRDQVDLGYIIDDRHVFIVEISPHFQTKQKTEIPVAKATYVIRQKLWKIYWMPGNLKWTIYEPKYTVKKLSAFLKVVEEDKYACFFG